MLDHIKMYKENSLKVALNFPCSKNLQDLSHNYPLSTRLVWKRMAHGKLRTNVATSTTTGRPWRHSATDKRPGQAPRVVSQLRVGTTLPLWLSGKMFHESEVATEIQATPFRVDFLYSKSHTNINVWNKDPSCENKASHVFCSSWSEYRLGVRMIGIPDFQSKKVLNHFWEHWNKFWP